MVADGTKGFTCSAFSVVSVCSVDPKSPLEVPFFCVFPARCAWAHILPFSVVYFSCVWCVSWFLNPHVVLRRRRFFDFFVCSVDSKSPLAVFFLCFSQHVVLGAYPSVFCGLFFSCISSISWFLNSHAVLCRRRFFDFFVVNPHTGSPATDTFCVFCGFN